MIRAFSIVELLVVTAIVAIISALLTIGVIEGRKYAFRSTCLQNLYQLGVATKLYTADTDGFLPPHSFFNPKDYQTEIAGWKRCLKAYGASSGQFFCPADHHQQNETPSEWHDHSETSYMMSLHIFAIADRNTPKFRANLDRVVNPAETDLYFDLDTIVRDETSQPVRRWTGHGAQYNAVFVDGHVGTKRLPSP